MSLRVVIWAAVSSGRQATEDKISLDEQVHAGRDWAAQNGGEVVSILNIPGESRSDTDVLSIFEEFAAAGVYAYHDLRRLWQEPRGFDVLFCYHESRLGRSESLFTYVVSNVMRSGAKIFCHLGGWYEPKDYKLKMAIGMINVSSEMDRLTSLGWAAKEKKASSGSMVHGQPPWSHHVVRDETGKVMRFAPDDTKRPIIEAAAKLLLEGTPWQQIEHELYARYGYVNPDTNKPFFVGFFHSLFFKPTFWGHAVRGYLAKYKTTHKTRHKLRSLWVIDASAPAPEDIKIWRNVAPPYLPINPTGHDNDNLGGLVRDEMLRRHHINRGHSGPKTTYRFSGLLACYHCGYIMSFGSSKGGTNRRYYCKSVYGTAAGRCDHVRSILESTVQEWVNAALVEIIRENDPTRLIRREDVSRAQKRREQLEASVKRLGEQINRAVTEQLATEDTNLRRIYREQLARMSTEAIEAERELNRLMQVSAESHSSVADSYARLKEIVDEGDLSRFWQSPDQIINQILYGMLGDTLLVAKDGKIEGFSKRKKSRPTRK